MNNAVCSEELLPLDCRFNPVHPECHCQCAYLPRWFCCEAAWWPVDAVYLQALKVTASTPDVVVMPRGGATASVTWVPMVALQKVELATTVIYSPTLPLMQRNLILEVVCVAKLFLGKAKLFA